MHHDERNLKWVNWDYFEIGNYYVLLYNMYADMC